MPAFTKGKSQLSPLEVEKRGQLPGYMLKELLA